MALRTFLFLCAAVVSLPSQVASQTTGSCRVDVNIMPPRVACIGPMEVEAIQNYLRDVATYLTKNINTFYLSNNPTITRLPANLLGDMRFSEVWVTDCSNLVEADDFLGATKDTLGFLYLLGNSLSQVPRLTAPDLYKFYMHQSQHFVIQRQAFQGMKNVWILDFSYGVSIEPLAFYDLKNLVKLTLMPSPHEPLTEGSLHFDPQMTIMIYITGSSLGGEIEVGTFGGLMNSSILILESAAKISPDIFYNVVSKKPTLSIGEPMTCDCQVAWIRLSDFIEKTRIKCSNGTSIVDLKDIDETQFANCGEMCSL